MTALDKPKTYALGDSIRAARQRAGMDQYELAERVRVTQSTVSQWESGRTRPTRRHLEAMAPVLDLPLQLLLEVARVSVHGDAVALAVKADRLDDRTRRALIAFIDTHLAGG